MLPFYVVDIIVFNLYFSYIALVVREVRKKIMEGDKGIKGR